MELGVFSISLAVKDIVASKAFYEKLGFVQFGGDIARRWVMLKNGTTVIGLFQGVIPQNTLTFNPKWDHNAQEVSHLPDVREIQAHLLEQDVSLGVQADPATSGPAYITLTDPDGNPILIDQHV